MDGGGEFHTTPGISGCRTMMTAAVVFNAWWLWPATVTVSAILAAVTGRVGLGMIRAWYILHVRAGKRMCCFFCGCFNYRLRSFGFLMCVVCMWSTCPLDNRLQYSTTECLFLRMFFRG